MASSLHKILDKNLNKPNNFLKYSFQLIKELSKVTLPDDSFLMSLDVVSLFIHVPFDLIIKSIDGRARIGDGNIDNNISLPKGEFFKAITLILDSTCFNDGFYKLFFGVPIGSPLSPISVIINCSGSCDARFKRIHTYRWKKFIVKEVAVLRKGAILSHYIFTCSISWNMLTKSEKYYASWLSAYHYELQ